GRLPLRARLVRIGLRVGLSGRRIAAASWMCIARARWNARTELHLAPADFLHQIGDEKHGGENHGDEDAEAELRVLNRKQQLDSEHTPPPPVGDAMRVPH